MLIRTTLADSSNFKGTGINLSIIDSAKDLLFRMLGFSGGVNQMQLYWRAAHIFVARSMRGLLVKKAYVLGKYDSEYGDIMSKTQGIMLLATVHRGAHNAKMLNNPLHESILCTTKSLY